MVVALRLLERCTSHGLESIARACCLAAKAQLSKLVTCAALKLWTAWQHDSKQYQRMFEWQKLACMTAVHELSFTFCSGAQKNIEFKGDIDKQLQHCLDDSSTLSFLTCYPMIMSDCQTVSLQPWFAKPRRSFWLLLSKKSKVFRQIQLGTASGPL